ncbi:DUF2238 domain-containing protein [Fictibacillus iocasae]|uniref:DUF2238 domain-containing protein n=1 Tax=Fictibacillus iocasae TaxID=2715437 RepID=A0ABW2NLZ1_9BACL
MDTMDSDTIEERMIMLKRYLLCLLFIISGFFIWSAINPADTLTWVLETFPGAFIAIVFVYQYYRKQPLTLLVYSIIAVLIILTFIGGHYTYDDVPLFDTLARSMGWERNPYDRVGHFLKGSLAIVFRELLLLYTPLVRGRWLQCIAVCFVAALASLYEMIEFIAAKIMGKSAEDFQGMQGDLWDAQWDMILAFSGSILALLLLTAIHDKALRAQAYKNKRQ